MHHHGDATLTGLAAWPARCGAEVRASDYVLCWLNRFQILPGAAQRRGPGDVATVGDLHVTEATLSLPSGRIADVGGVLIIAQTRLRSAR